MRRIYVADDRFTKNIDKHSEGTAAYIAKCIKSYCANTIRNLP